MDAMQYAAVNGIPIPTVPDIDVTPSKPSGFIFPADELAAATAHFQGLQERAPWAWKSYEEVAESEKREVRQYLRNNRRQKKLADWWGTTIFTSHEEARKYCVPLSPSVHTSSGESEASVSEIRSKKVERVRGNEQRIGAQCWARYRNDHTRACGGSAVPVPRQPFRFMDLPTEIRLQVFKILLTHDKEIVQMPVNNPTKDYQWLPVDTRVFTVNSRVKEEAEQVFYRNNTFRVDAHDLLPLFILRLAGPAAANAKALFRRIHVRILYRVTIPSSAGKPEALRARDDLQQRLKLTSRALMQCTRLTLIEMTPMYRAGRLVRRGLSRDFDKFIGCFAEIRGVENVVFTDAQKIREDNHDDNQRRLRTCAWGSKEQTERLKAMMQTSKPFASGEG